MPREPHFPAAVHASTRAESFFCSGFGVNSVLRGRVAPYLWGGYDRSVMVCLTRVVPEFPPAVAARGGCVCVRSLWLGCGTSERASSIHAAL